MLNFVLALCAVALTWAGVAYLLARKRLVDHEIDQIIERKLETRRDQMTTEILDLREANSVMRNLLMDIAENEATAGMVSDLPAEVTTRIASTRVSRRRDLLAETEAVLRSSFADDAKM